jgi:cytosine deaminase
MTVHPAKILKLPDYGIAVGAAADLVVLDVPDRAHAVMEIARPVMAMKRGRITMRRSPAELLRP